VGVIQQPIEQRDGGGRVAEQRAPVLDEAIRGDQRRGGFIAAHHDLQGVLSRGRWEFTHAEAVEDEGRDGREVSERGLASTGELGIASSSTSVWASR
jgi:hypothetical protein